LEYTQLEHNAILPYNTFIIIIWNAILFAGSFVRRGRRRQKRRERRQENRRHNPLLLLPLLPLR